jgi:hypothetical protein
VSSAGGSFSYTGLHVDSDWDVRCSTYDDHAPILSLGAGTCGISVYISGKDTTRVVEFARALLRDVQVFTAEIERMYGAPDGSNAAGEAA